MHDCTAVLCLNFLVRAPQWSGGEGLSGGGAGAGVGGDGGRVVCCSAGGQTGSITDYEGTSREIEEPASYEGKTAKSELCAKSYLLKQ